MSDLTAELAFVTPPTREQLQAIYESSERMFGKIKSFVELSEIEGNNRRKYRLKLKIKEQIKIYFAN